MPFIVIGTALAAALTMLLAFIIKRYDPAAPTASLIVFFITLMALLISMGLYRSPAVALMADVTPKPLRSQGNAVINLMGAFGGLYTLVMIKLLAKADSEGHYDYTLLFLSVIGLMIAAVTVLMLTIRERKLVEEMKAINYLSIMEDEDEDKYRKAF